MHTKEFVAHDWVKSIIKERVRYYPDTGVLVWKPRATPKFNDKFAGRVVGFIDTQKSGYVYYGVMLEMKGRKLNIPAARIAWLLHTGDWPKETIDHIDRNPLNNKFINLRDVSQAVNNDNRREYDKGFMKGMAFKRGSFWEVTVSQQYFGSYKCLGQALKARDKARVGMKLEPMMK